MLRRNAEGAGLVDGGGEFLPVGLQPREGLLHVLDSPGHASFNAPLFELVHHGALRSDLVVWTVSAKTLTVGIRVLYRLDMAELGIGPRVKALRVQRGLTQQQLATALGMSLPWVKSFEGGGLQTDPRLSVLKSLARTLAVPLAVLVDDDPDGSDDTSADEVRAALLTPAAQQDPGLDVLQQTTYGYHAFHAGRWHDAVALLPRLINAARAREGGAGEPRALAQLADVCHLAAVTLTTLGDAVGGWAAGHEGVLKAEAAGDPIGIALATQSAVYAATASGRPDVGLGLAQDVIDRYGGDLRGLGDDGVSALGMVYLKAAYAAGSLPDPGLATLMIEQGRALAALIAPDANHRLSTFNITNVSVYEASILGDLGLYDQALQAVMQIDPRGYAALPRERRIHHLVDTARSAQRAGKPDTALRLLLDAEREDPATVRSWNLARAVIADLITEQTPADGRGLRALALRAGVAL